MSCYSTYRVFYILKKKYILRRVPIGIIYVFFINRAPVAADDKTHIAILKRSRTSRRGTHTHTHTHKHYTHVSRRKLMILTVADG